MEKRLRPKYLVRLVDNENEIQLLRHGEMESTDPDNPDSPFVLMPRKDPAAFAALITYSQVCEPQLAQEIAEWLQKVARAAPVFGTQGIRNFESVRMQAVMDIKVSR